MTSKEIKSTPEEEARPASLPVATGLVDKSLNRARITATLKQILFTTGVTSRALCVVHQVHQPFYGACRSELAREYRRFTGNRSIREQARSYARADDWLRPFTTIAKSTAFPIIGSISDSMMSNKGFTLIELMVTVVIAAILLTTAMPGFEALITNNRLSTQANAFIGALHFARSEAIKRNLDVTVCKSGDGLNCSNNASGFEQGWIVFVDQQNLGTRDNGEAIINTNQGMPQGMSLDDQTVSYGPDGTPASFNNTTLRLCQQRNNNGRHIVISVTGRVRVEESNDCPIN